MSNSKVQTRSYFIKRMRDCGYYVDRVAWDYSEKDSRKWAVIMDNGGTSVIITCYKDNSFHFYDGCAYAKNHLKIVCESIEVLIGYLNDWGFIHKHSSYGKVKTAEIT